MANYIKSFNFKNGVQVDNDNFIVNANGLVGIGTTILQDYILTVFGDVKVSGFITAKNLSVENFLISGITSYSSINVGNTLITSGIITASSGVVTYYGDGSKLLNLPTSQWTTLGSNIYSIRNVGILTTNPEFTFQVGPNPLVNPSGGVGINSNGNVYAIGIITAASFSGSGTNLTSLNASNITSGTLSTSFFPSNLQLSGIVTASGFSGSGSSITSLNASNIASGTLNNSRLPSNISVSGIITASSFVGNLTGTATTALNLSSAGSLSVNSINSGFTSTGIATVTNSLFVVGFPAKIGVGTASNVQGDIEVRKSGISSINVISDSSVATIGIGRSAEVRTGNTNNFYPYSTRNSLDVINSNPDNLNFYLDYGASGLGTGNFNWIYGQNPSNPLMTLTYRGNLGLGITNPPSKLYVVGSSYLTGITTIDSNLNVSNNLTVSGSIFGSGSNLTNVVNSITAGSGISLNQSTGNVTISATGSIISSQWVSTASGIHTTSNVGIGSTIPTNKLQVELYGVQTGVGTFDAMPLSGILIDGFSILSNNYKCVEYTLHFENQGNIQSQKVLVMQNGVTAYSQEYAIMYHPNQIVSIGATISENSLILEATPEAGITGLTTYRFVRQSIV